MNTPPKTPSGPAQDAGADDPSIPVLTERLGLPPLEFDTTLPLIDTTHPSPPRSFEGLTALPNPPPAPPLPAPLSAPPPAAHAPLVPPSAPPTARRMASSFPETAALASLPPTPPPPPAGPAVAMTPATTTVHGALRPGSDGGHWARIEVELRTSILRAVAEHLPQDIEAVVRTQMSASIDLLINRLAAETRSAITATLRETVESAVRAELQRLRGGNRGSS